MSVRTFLRFTAILAVAFACWGIYVLTHLWNEQTIGAFDVRQNTLTGIVQIKAGDEWRVPFDHDPYATPLAPADLKRVSILDGAWGQNGLYCARALVAPGPGIKGRLALRFTIQDVVRHQRIRERELRETVDWPGGSLTPFVLRTGLSAPDEKNQKTIVTLLPTSYSGN